MAPTTFIVYVITALGLTITFSLAADSSSQQRKNHHHQQQQPPHHQHSGHQQHPHRKSSHHRQHPPSPTAPLESCEAVKRAFVDDGIGAAHLVPHKPIPGSSLKRCPSPETCCREAMVHRYQNSIVRDYDSVLANVVAPLKAQLQRSIAQFEHHFNQLLQISLNNTNNLFQAVYPRMATDVAPRLHDLYGDFRAFLLQGHKVDVLDSLRGFFDGLFPSVYYHALNPKLTDFTDDYKECLQQARSEVHPFGQIMRGIELTVPHALTAAELFLNALRTGSNVINSTSSITSSHECKHALLKLTYCAHCSGHTKVAPCWGMCLNVMRGCLAQLTEIDRNWNQYINALEDLIGVMKSPFNTEEVFDEFPEKISEAIMHALEHGKDLDGRVRRACGQPKRIKPRVHIKDDDKNKNGHRREKRHVGVSPAPSSQQSTTSTDGHQTLAERLNSFLTAISPSKGFFYNLADTTCKDKKFSGHAHQGQHCWNGIEIGAYNQTIVGVGIERQQNNPELKVQKHDGANSKVIAAIIEKLLRIKQHMTGSPVTREISKSSKKTREGQNIFNARGAREAQYYGGGGGNYGNSMMESGSGYYGDQNDKYYDDEDLYGGSGDGGSGDYREYGSGGPVTDIIHPPIGNTRRIRPEPGEKPMATKNPAQTSHTYMVHPVQDNKAASYVVGDGKLIFVIAVIVNLLSGII